MFKIESYITPILLSYVDKYIKNFKPEDSQLSLWGGEVSFHNLDLRLEVLEEELQLPFSFVSGHIHELIIHVPWTKLTSEPICVTINTIECILKLRGEDAGSPETGIGDSRRRTTKSTDVVAPPGYIQTLVNKIVSNITINCCNLIVKYVEEDIVMSMNVKNLVFQSANDQWQHEFSDLLSSQLMHRKIISLSDVTVCLDKRNASGKIDSYQEPVLYRCSMTMRLLRCYNSASSHRAAITRLDVHCHKMAFNISEVQVPMMMRLLLLARALQSREVGQRCRRADTDAFQDPEDGDDKQEESLEQESWAGWAWNLVPSVLPSGWGDDWSDDGSESKGYTFHCGIYIDELAFNLRVGESNVSDRNWKSKLEPFLMLSLRGCFLDSVGHASTWFNTHLGICSIQLEPAGSCSCGLIDSADKPTYLSAGSFQEQYYSDSLFSDTAVENLGGRRKYNFSWDLHQNTVTESKLIEKTPALAIDYLYMVELPDGFNPEKLLDFNGDLEYSNLPEHALCRVVAGPFLLRINSGLLHRSNRVLEAALLYDYQPYSFPPPEDRREQLPTVTTEEYDSLEENIPLRTYQLTVFQPTVEVQIADHPIPPGHGRRKISVQHHEHAQSSAGPVLSVTCQCIDTRYISPMYPRRLVRTACLLPSLPQHMFHACHSHIIAKILGLSCSMSLLPKCEHSLFSVTNISLKRKELLLEHLWDSVELLHTDDSLDIESLRVTATKAQLILTQKIILSLMTSSSIVEESHVTTLIRDAFTQEGSIILEVALKNVMWQKVMTRQTRCDRLTVASVEAHTINRHSVSLILSGTGSASSPLLLVCLQWPISRSQHVHPPVFLVRIKEALCSLDPQLCTWLLYCPNIVPRCHQSMDKNVQSNRIIQRKISETSHCQTSAERSRHSQTPLSVHSSERERDRDPPPQVAARLSAISAEQSHTDACEIEEWELSTWLVDWYSTWQGLVLSVDVARWCLAFPSVTIPAPKLPMVVAGTDRSFNLVCVDLPVIQMFSATPTLRHRSQLFTLPLTLPIRLSSTVLAEGGTNFPWNISMTDKCIWTISDGLQQYLLKPVSTKCTVGISSRFSNNDKEQLTSLGLCIHNDTGPLHFNLNQAQAQLVCSLLIGVSAVVGGLFFSDKPQNCPAHIAPISPTTLSESASLSESRQNNKNSFSDGIGAHDTLKLSLWLQWTLARMLVNLYHSRSDSGENKQVIKLSLELEDLMTALDLQQIYCKVKLKLAGAKIHHYLRFEDESEWRLAPHQGLVMCGYEEMTPVTAGQVPSDEGCGLLTVTMTRAKCHNVHSKWGAPITSTSSAKRFAESKADLQFGSGNICFITEVLVKLQPLDFLLSMDTLTEWISVLLPFSYLLGGNNREGTSSFTTASSLPLLYLDLQAIRLLMPLTSDHDKQDDTFIIQVDSITLSPHTENPLLRTPIRPDLFHMAEQARILTVPGSEVEDRQYELSITGLAVSTGQWQDMDHCRRLSAASASSSLRTMSENPALVWNSLAQNTQTDRPGIAGPQPKLKPILSPLRICVVAAPAIIYRNKVLVCGQALEVNACSNVEVTLTSSQLHLAAELTSEMLNLWHCIILQSGITKPHIPSYVAMVTEKQNHQLQMRMDAEHSLLIDSGIDTGDVSSVETPQSMRPRGARRISRSVRCLETVHGGPSQSLPTTHTQSRWRERESISTLSRPPHEGNTDLLASSRSSISHKGRSTTSPETISTKERIQDAPFDFLLTARKISVMLYEDVLKQKMIEDSQNSEETDHIIVPLMYILVAQPHAFVTQMNRIYNMQVSVYDTLVKLGSPCVNVSDTPLLSECDFLLPLLESCKGDPHPKTGIPPALCTVHFTCARSKTAQVKVDCGRPVKLTCSMTNMLRLQHVICVTKSSIEQLLKEKVASPEPSLQTKLSGAEQIREVLAGVSCVNVNTTQLIIVVKAETEECIESQAELCVASISGELSCMSRTRWGSTVATVERVACNLSCHSLALATSYSHARRLLLQPCLMGVRLELLWPAWLPRSSTLPHTQLSICSEYLSIDVSPDHCRSLTHLLAAYQPMFQSANSDPSPHIPPSTPASEACSSETGTESVDTEQQYTDDLRAGAFQFMDATDTMERDQLPLPYQCVFWESSPPAMAWRYPQPRTLTNLQIFPVPFKSSQDAEVGREEAPVVVCSLQYWSECRGAYQPYATFLLLETEVSQLELPSTPGPAVSAAWRVLLAGTQDLHDPFPIDSSKNYTLDTEVPMVSPRALAACMRVDSYFSASLAPSFQTALNITLLQVSLVNQLGDSLSRSMPQPLRDYTLDGSMPDYHSFLWLSLNHATLFCSMWPEGSKTVEFCGLMRWDVLDYSSLTQQSIVEPFLSRLCISVKSDGSVDVSLVSRSIALRLGPSTAHTLAVSTKLWHQEWLTKDTSSPQVIVTQYVLCNNTVIPLRFGQVGTDEEFPLPSRQCHMYTWRSLSKAAMLHVSLVDPSMLSIGNRIWSTPFSIDSCGIKVCKIQIGPNKEVILFVKITTLLDTQKQVTVSGQLTVSNQLNEVLDMRVMRPVSDWSLGACGCSVTLQPYHTIPSLLLDRNVNEPQLALRLRQQGTNLWTGDIPLRENPKSHQPWLVKVPLQEKGQFISIWCRIIRQNIDGHVKILVLLCPLYALRSLLPYPVKVSLTHNQLKDESFSLELQGQGDIQLPCFPGTLIEHTFKLKLETEMSEGNTFVLGYASVDQKLLFQVPDQPDIDSVLESFGKIKSTVWPLPDSEFQSIQWVGTRHSDTYVQVSCGPLSPFSGTLLAELRPWALVVNLLGSSISLQQADKVMVSLPSRGVTAPPKLEGTFQLGKQFVEGGDWYFSEALQLTRAEWGKSFYMPRISGLIPTEGHIRITLSAGPLVSLLTLTSQIHNDVRVFSVRPTFVASNSSSVPLRVTAFAIRHVDMNRRLNIPSSSSPETLLATITILPDSSNKGYPLESWLHLKSCETDVVPFLSVSTVDNGPMSCPLRLTGCLARRRFTVPLPHPVNAGNHLRHLTTKSLVICVLETNGQTFINIADEPHPQIVLHNLCDFRILSAQGCPVSRGNPSECKALAEAVPWEWVCGVDPHTEAQYNLMAVEEAFPQIPPTAPTPSLLLAVDTTATSTVLWSAGIQLTGSQEQFISLPGHGDVKVRLWNQCYTTHVCIEAVSRVEISARDIRSRLLAAPGIPSHGGTLDGELPVGPLEVVVPPPLSEIDSKSRISNSDSGILSGTVNRRVSIAAFVHSCTLTLTAPFSPTDEMEVASITLDQICVTAHPCSHLPVHSQTLEMSAQITIGDFQLDNHLFERGGFDFPVVLMGQQDGGEKLAHNTVFSLGSTAAHLIEKLSPEALLAVRLTFETSPSGLVPKTVHISVGPLTAYVEDTFVMQLAKDMAALLSPTLALWETSKILVIPVTSLNNGGWVPAPVAICWEWQVLEKPLRLTSLTLDPLWLLLSVHSCMRLYIALDRSPLQFTQFCRRSICTTAYNLGHSLTMHYLSGAIFGAGWVVGSLELLGSPGGFARTLGTGLRDFVSLPYRGILQGPWGFLVGVTHGSASLMKHFTAGTLNSVTKMASSVARNLDRLTLDAEHLQRTEEMRRLRPQGVAEGLLQGLTGLGISLLGAVGGLAHHPLQSVLSGAPSPRDVVTGVGRGLVGVFTKPLSGAADLVALTGQGLLQGAGWSNLPQLRHQARTEQASSRRSAPLKYSVKIQRNSVPSCLLLLEATQELSTGRYQAVTLVLTSQTLTVLTANNDVLESSLSLTDLCVPETDADPTMLTLAFKTPLPQVDQRIWDFINGCQNMMNVGPPALENTSDSRPTTPPTLPSNLPLSMQALEHQSAPEIDDVNPNLNLSQSSSEDGVSPNAPPTTETVEPPKARPPLVFHVNPQLRGHFLSILKMAQCQLQGRGFSIL